MRCSKICTLGALASLALLVSPAPAALGDDGQLARGASIVEEKCARCHAIGKAGASPLAIAPPFRELSRRYPVESLAESLAEGIMTGHQDMPEYRFSPTDVDAIIAYLRSIQPG